MSTEFVYLFASIGLGLVHVLLTGAVTTLQHGLKYNMGTRDAQLPLIGIPARIVRAYANFMQTFPFFAALVVMLHVLNIHTQDTVLGVMLYFWARLLFIPAYAFGINGVRTLLFIASLVGIARLFFSLPIAF